VLLALRVKLGMCAVMLRVAVMSNDHQQSPTERNEAGQRGGRLDNEEWAKLHGMHHVAPAAKQMRDAFGAGIDKGGGPLRTSLPPFANGFMMSMMHGPRQAVNEVKSMIDTSAVVCALLLSTTLPMLLAPPDEIMDLGRGHGLRVMTIVGSGISTLCSLCNILFAVMYGVAANRLVRDSDCWRLMLSEESYLSSVDMSNR
jgi:hypothetical protein